MIVPTLTYTAEQAKQFFEAVGLEVRFCYMLIPFVTGSEYVYVWCVINPHTQKPELLEKAFVRCIESRKDLLLNADRIEVYNLFPKR